MMNRNYRIQVEAGDGDFMDIDPAKHLLFSIHDVFLEKALKTYLGEIDIYLNQKVDEGLRYDLEKYRKVIAEKLEKVKISPKQIPVQ